MKKLFTFITVFLLTVFLNAQLVEDWTPPVALTDSTINDSNPIVIVLEVNGIEEVFMIYDKGAPYDRTIWWKKISEPMWEEQMLVGGWPFDYGNPKILFNNYLVFEFNGGDQYDLAGAWIDANGVVTGTDCLLTETENDENSFFADPYNSNICCWESEGSIYTAEPQYYSQDSVILANIEIVDSLFCFDPVCKNNYVAWRKVENNESHIYYSRKTYPLYQWSEPDTIININYNINLSLSTSVPDMGGGYTLCWQSQDKIYFSNTWGSNIYISTPELPGIDNYYEPTAFHLVLLTESIPELYSFAGEIESERDIYIVDNMFLGEVLNISDDEHMNKNPKLFSGRVNWPYYEIFNVWQTEIDGMNVLFESHALYMATGSIDENETLQLNLFPNPFTETLNIELMNDQSEVAILEIFSISGERLFHKEIQGQPTQNNPFPGIRKVKVST